MQYSQGILTIYDCARQICAAIFYGSETGAVSEPFLRYYILEMISIEGHNSAI